MINIIQKGNIRSINISVKKGVKKTPVESAVIDLEGIKTDAHAGAWHRQISLLADESADRMRKVAADIAPGDFAENITTRGIDFKGVRIGQKIMINDKVSLEITQIGKECHDFCEIKKKVGYCVMPTEGIFARVITGGGVKIGDEVIIYE
ncbi:MAG: MOSC domain protein [bacterium ADurb.Bin243]|nr:MAG: MOSC domain protein [bacterium ADurb.Bin243]